MHLNMSCRIKKLFFHKHNIYVEDKDKLTKENMTILDDEPQEISDEIWLVEVKVQHVSQSESNQNVKHVQTTLFGGKFGIDTRDLGNVSINLSRSSSNSEYLFFHIRP